MDQDQMRKEGNAWGGMVQNVERTSALFEASTYLMLWEKADAGPYIQLRNTSTIVLLYEHSWRMRCSSHFRFHA
jgi:hypothetical protein